MTSVDQIYKDQVINISHIVSSRKVIPLYITTILFKIICVTFTGGNDDDDDDDDDDGGDDDDDDDGDDDDGDDENSRSRSITRIRTSGAHLEIITNSTL